MSNNPQVLNLPKSQFFLFSSEHTQEEELNRLGEYNLNYKNQNVWGF